LRPKNLAALQSAMAAGIEVVLATGRMFRSARPYAEAIGTSQPIICYQGAVVRSPAGELLRDWPLTAEAAAHAVRFSRSHGVHVNLYYEDNFYVEAMGEGARRYAAVAQVEPVLVPDLMAIAARGSTKVVFVDDPARLRGLEAEMRATFEPGSRVTFSLPEFLEVVSAEASKGAALKFVSERQGIAATDVMAVGDAPNDVEMLRFAGRAVATRTGFPEALAVAGEVIPPPEEDGIAALVELLLGGD
jgi:Cof subfamily protein (haloacid dehalogenase superfamily)